MAAAAVTYGTGPGGSWASGGGGRGAGGTVPRGPHSGSSILNTMVRGCRCRAASGWQWVTGKRRWPQRAYVCHFDGARLQPPTSPAYETPASNRLPLRTSRPDDALLLLPALRHAVVGAQLGAGSAGCGEPVTVLTTLCSGRGPRQMHAALHSCPRVASPQASRLFSCCPAKHSPSQPPNPAHHHDLATGVQVRQRVTHVGHDQLPADLAGKVRTTRNFANMQRAQWLRQWSVVRRLVNPQP